MLFVILVGLYFLIAIIGVTNDIVKSSKNK